MTRAALTPGRVILLADRGETLVALDAATGATVWEHDLGLATRHVTVHGGVLVTAHRDLNRDDGLLRLHAFDAMTGSGLWTTLLGRADPGPLVADADHVWLRRTRYATTATYQDAVVLDIADGRILHELPLPAFPFGEAWSDGKHLVAAGSSSRTQPPALVAYDLDSGASTWRLDLPGEAPTALATSPEGRLVVLTGEGRVREIDAATGAVVHETGIFVGENTAVRPFFGTPLLVQDDRLVLLPGLRSRGATLLAYARDTGKLVWEHPLTPEGFVGTAALGAAGDQIWAFVLRGARQDVSAELVVVDRVGSVSQRVDLSELAQGGRHPTVLQAYGAFLVVGRRDASILK